MNALFQSTNLNQMLDCFLILRFNRIDAGIEIKMDEKLNLTIDIIL